MAESGEKGHLLADKIPRSTSPEERPTSPADAKPPASRVGRRSPRPPPRPLLARLSEDPQPETPPSPHKPEVVPPAPPPPPPPPPASSTPPPRDDGCPDYFGVRSYLHHFYEHVAVKDPSLYEQPRDSEEDEDDHFRFLVGGDEGRDRARRGLCWRLSVWGGANLMILGAIAVLVGSIVPRRPVLVGIVTPELEVVDRTAVRFNAALDACALSGLGLFGAGGALVALALLASSMLRTRRPRPRPPQFAWSHVPLQTNIPATESFATIQPQSVEEERLLKGKNIIP